MALLIDYIDKEDPSLRISAIMGLGITYAGSQNERVNCFSLFIFGQKYVSVITFLDIHMVCFWHQS